MYPYDPATKIGRFIAMGNKLGFTSFKEKLNRNVSYKIHVDNFFLNENKIIYK